MWSEDVEPEDEIDEVGVEEQNVAKEGDFDWLDEYGDLELHWDDEVDDVNVKNTDELVKWREIEISTYVGEDFTEAISDVLNQIDLEGEKDFVESEDELKSIGSSSDIEGENSLLVYREGDEKKHSFHYKVGMIFSSNSQFKWAVEVHEAVNNKSIKFTKNDKRRVQAKCRDQGSDFLAHSISNPSEHGGATAKDNISIKILLDTIPRIQHNSCMKPSIIVELKNIGHNLGKDEMMR
nr:uncharacterized protein LOC109179198 [Ipomoea batatas]